MTILRRVSAAAAAGVIVLFGLALPASAAPAPDITVSPDTVALGESVTVAGEGCGPGRDESYGEVYVQVGNDPAVAGVADVEGAWSVVVTPTTAGTHPVTATCDLYEGSFDYPPGSVTVIPPAEPQSAEFGDVTRDGCRVTIPVTVGGAGEYTLRVWDDGEVVEEVTWDAEAGSTNTATWTITEAAGEQAPGVGFYVYDADGNELPGRIDPWEYPAEVADACFEAGDLTMELGDGKDTYAPGDTVTFTASGFWPDEEVELTLESEPVFLASFLTDDSGRISGSATIPADTQPGRHSLVLRGMSSGLSILASITVTAPPTSTPTTTVTPPPLTPTAPRPPILAATGVDTAGLAGWGIGLALLGGVALALGRRRGGRHVGD